MTTFRGILRTMGSSLAVMSFLLAGCDGGASSTTGDGGGGSTPTGGAGDGGTGGGGCAAEICGDGADNDCDGAVDDADSDCSDCTPGDTTACYTGPDGTEGVGACKSGTATCGADGKLGPCTGDVLPATETCDGADNDCNGAVDDKPSDVGAACDTGQPGECAAGTGACTNGAITCVPDVTAAAETCDGLDNDCDGTVDNAPSDVGAPCDTGLLGVCAAGTDACVNGAIECIQDIAAGAEACDGVDNNCDGTVDEGNPDGGAACDTGLDGVCANGEETCQGGKLACAQTVMPSMEACDGQDNDCNGTVDEGNPGGGGTCNTGLFGVCGAGAEVCTNGALTCVQTGMPSAETCDGADNDCNGATDEGNPGGGLGCGTGLPGVCGAGMTTCQNGAVVCAQTQMPGAEACDGQDNDCNGVVDDGNPGGGLGCGTGLPGVCGPGTTVCQNGAIACNQLFLPSAETCDGQDNDCNGAVDDGNPGGGGACTVPGVLPPCSAGTNQCQNGAIVCVSSTPPQLEVCDGQDNDCDGHVDDGPLALAVYLHEDFSDNGAGWTTSGQWAIGATSASTGQSYGGPDPANDHTTTNDNGVAGAVLGGNVSTAVVAMTYLTSPVINTAAAPGKVYLSFWRWLNSDYSPYMVNQVEVYNGSAWTTLFQTGAAPGVQDSAWQKQQYEITAYKSAAMQIRFGYSVTSGAYTVSGWNIDDVVVSNSPYPTIYLADEFSDNSNAWTLGTSWAIGATATSTGHSYGGPDPAADHTAGANNGVMGVVLGGNAPINHAYYYTTSKVLDTSGADVLNLSFWRWLNSDYSPYMVNQVEVYNGASWQTVYQTGASPGVQDAAWTSQSLNILAHKAEDMQVRIGYTATSSAYTVSSWNVDDMLITGGTICQ